MTQSLVPVRFLIVLMYAGQFVFVVVVVFVVACKCILCSGLLCPDILYNAVFNLFLCIPFKFKKKTTDLISVTGFH